MTLLWETALGKDNHQQSVGGQSAIDGLSGSGHSGTEGADNGQGVNKGAGAGSHGHVGQQSGDNTTKKDDKKNQPTP